ncbi:Hypothetical protein Tpal_474 [Trichococcus palustris]|uniref:Uncharacterized protein n=2 Tax=Trichococcus palustris TaxID=140314 RepID=A0A143YA51_9LACT|nr:Hypothetical protein Tpal_474 [Trichococcus palustris]SFK70348.1 hypothetical protein SAMN04488076_103184 [Trichococcus palustris]
MKPEKYIEMLIQIEAAENCFRDMRISAARYQAEADRAARKARAFEHKIVRLQRQLEEMEEEGMQ